MSLFLDVIDLVAKSIKGDNDDYYPNMKSDYVTVKQDVKINYELYAKIVSAKQLAKDNVINRDSNDSINVVETNTTIISIPKFNEIKEYRQNLMETCKTAHQIKYLHGFNKALTLLNINL